MISVSEGVDVSSPICRNEKNSVNESTSSSSVRGLGVRDGLGVKIIGSSEGEYSRKEREGKLLWVANGDGTASGRSTRRDFERQQQSLHDMLGREGDSESDAQLW